MSTMYTATGTKVYIAASVAAEPADATAYAAETWVEVKNVFDAGEVGDNANIVSAATLADGRVNKAKGARDAGNANLVVLPLTADAGQDALDAAELTSSMYPIKYVLNNALNATGTGEIQYFCAIVSGKRTSIGQNDGVLKKTYPLAITTKITKVAATAGS